MRKSRLNCNLKTMVTDWSTWHKMMGFIRPFFPTLDKLRDFFRFKSLPTTTTNKRCYQNLLNQSKLVSFTKLIWLNLKKEKHHDKNSSKCCGIFFGSWHRRRQRIASDALLNQSKLILCPQIGPSVICK